MKILDIDNIDIVIYHGSCYGSFGCAFIIWLYYKRKFGKQRADNIKYVASSHLKNEQILEKTLEDYRGKNVIFCDFAYPLADMKRLENYVNSYLIVDHHEAIIQSLKILPEENKIFNKNKSGVGLVWDLFFPNESFPLFLGYIQDRDLWKYELPNTKEFVTYFYEQKFSFDIWEKYLDIKHVKKAIEIGINWVEHEKVLIDNLISKSPLIFHMFNNEIIIVAYVNSPHLKSDIENAMIQTYPFLDLVVIWNYDILENETYMRFRSPEGNNLSLKVAEYFDGGGHPHSAGVKFKQLIALLPLPVMKDNETFKHPLLKMMRDKLYSKKEFETPKGKVSYIVITDIIQQDWLHESYLDMLKKKFKDCQLIIMQKTNDRFDVSAMNTIIKLHRYYIIYNHFSSSPSNLLLYNATLFKSYYMEFFSEKDIESIIKSFTMKNPMEDFRTSHEEDDDFISMDKPEVSTSPKPPLFESKLTPSQNIMEKYEPQIMKDNILEGSTEDVEILNELIKNEK
jgi:hypothetical protein